MVTRLAWMAAKLVSSKRETRYASLSERQRGSSHWVMCSPCLLEGHDGGRLESEVGLEVLGDLTDETLEGELSDEELGGSAKGQR